MFSDDDEGVTGLIEKPKPPYIPPARYISKFRDAVKIAETREKSAHKTLGVPNVPLRPPTDFLRKKSRPEFKQDDVKHNHYHIPGYQHKLPPWEKIKKSKESKDNLEKGEKSVDGDFKRRNIVKAKNLQPKKPRMYYVDDRRGSSYALIPSGLYPLYRDQKTSEKLAGGEEKLEGEIDELISSDANKDGSGEKKLAKLAKGSKKSGRKGTDKKSQLENDEESKTTTEDGGDVKTMKRTKISAKPKNKTARSRRQKQPMCRYVTEEERAELLYGMKKKYEETMQKFQVLPFLADTPPKAKRKANMEEDLKRLEKDIELIERNPHIYVYEGDE